MASASSSADDAGGSAEDNFDCNICLCPASEPVITRCGHLYCWNPCLYKWLQQGTGECPVCKAGVTRENVIPLYGRGRKRPAAQAAPPPSGSSADSAAASSHASAASSSDSAAASSSASSAPLPSDDIPSRPSGERPAPPPRPGASFWGRAGGNANAAGGGGGVQWSPFGMHFGGGNVFVSGFGLVPGLLGLAFANMHGGAPSPNGQPQQSTFGNIMLIVGILVLLMLIYA